MGTVFGYLGDHLGRERAATPVADDTEVDALCAWLSANAVDNPVPAELVAVQFPDIYLFGYVWIKGRSQIRTNSKARDRVLIDLSLFIDGTLELGGRKTIRKVFSFALNFFRRILG